MNVEKSVMPILYLVVGVVLISIVVSALMVLLYGPKATERTIVVERPWYHNYRGFWGHYGGGLPGWGGPKYPHPPPPHPKPPTPSPPPPPPSPSPPPASPPPANPPA